MIYLLKAFASLLVLFISLALSSEYKKYTDRKIKICEGFICLLSFIKTELSCRARVVSEWAAEFDNDALSESGFIPELLESGSLYSAFCTVKSKDGLLGNEVTRLLEPYFRSFGKAYVNEEEREACRVFEELSRLLTRERADAQRSVRAVRILSCAVALGVIILFL